MEMQIKWLVSIWYRFLQKGISEQTIEKSILEFVVKWWKNMYEEVLFDQNESFYGIFYRFWSQTPWSLIK